MSYAIGGPCKSYSNIYFQPKSKGASCAACMVHWRKFDSYTKLQIQSSILAKNLSNSWINSFVWGFLSFGIIWLTCLNTKHDLDYTDYLI